MFGAFAINLNGCPQKCNGRGACTAGQVDAKEVRRRGRLLLLLLPRRRPACNAAAMAGQVWAERWRRHGAADLLACQLGPRADECFACVAADDERPVPSSCGSCARHWLLLVLPRSACTAPSDPLAAPCAPAGRLPLLQRLAGRLLRESHLRALQQQLRQRLQRCAARCRCWLPLSRCLGSPAATLSACCHHCTLPSPAGKGECLSGFCKCEPGRFGKDCSRTQAFEPVPGGCQLLARVLLWRCC